MLQPEYTDTVQSASGVEEAAWVEVALEPAAAHMVQRTGGQGLASIEVVQGQPAEHQGAARRPERGKQAGGTPGSCHVQMDGETREQLQVMHGWRYWPTFRGPPLQRQGGLQPDEIGRRQGLPNVYHGPSSRRSPWVFHVYACELHV